MKKSTIEQYERAVVSILNFDGWDLQWSANDEIYDASGWTPKNKRCVIEMKFRNKYYETKLLEKKKYDSLMSLPSEVVKLYFVADPKGNYLFWLDNIDMSEIDGVQNVYAPKTTLWNKSKTNKDVYMIPEYLSSITNINEEEKIGVWDEYFDSRDKNNK
jgi:hypothetical protein